MLRECVLVATICRMSRSTLMPIGARHRLRLGHQAARSISISAISAWVAATGVSVSTHIGPALRLNGGYARSACGCCRRPSPAVAPPGTHRPARRCAGWAEPSGSPSTVPAAGAGLQPHRAWRRSGTGGPENAADRAFRADGAGHNASPGSRCGSRRPSSAPPCRWKYHQGMPFMDRTPPACHHSAAERSRRQPAAAPAPLP